MITTLPTTLAAFFLILISVSTLEAYDKTGHRIVAQVASENLTDEARTEIEKVLGRNGLVNYANWADEIRLNPAYAHTATWHFFNVDGDYSLSQLDSVFNSGLSQKNNVLFVIDSLRNVLRQNKSDTVALKYLVHLVGDLSQPLHIGRSVDKGGNLIRIRWLDDSINLHALWDTYLVNYEQLSYTEYATYLMTSTDLQRYDNTLKSAFIRSYLISRKIYAYDYEKMQEKLYYHTFSTDLKESLLNGGDFLAEMLNEMYS